MTNDKFWRIAICNFSGDKGWMSLHRLLEEILKSHGLSEEPLCDQALKNTRGGGYVCDFCSGKFLISCDNEGSLWNRLQKVYSEYLTLRSEVLRLMFILQDIEEKEETK